MIDQNEKKVVIFLLITILLLGMLCLFFNDLFFLILSEDHIVESMTSILYLLSSCFFLLLFLKSRRKIHIIFSLILFIFCLEEISYGQRFFGYETPLFMSKINVQDEVNIHNTIFFNSEIIFHFSLLVYFVFIPLMNRSRMKTFFKKIGLIVPSIYYSPFMGVFFSLLWIDYMLGKINIEEISELIVSLLFFFTAYFSFRGSRLEYSKIRKSED